MTTVELMVDDREEDVDDFEDIVDSPYGSTHAKMFVGDGEEDGIDEDFTIEQTGGCEADNVFDRTVGLLQEIVAGEEFQTVLKSFMEEHVDSFDAGEENKLCYTRIFEQYTLRIEEYMERCLAEQIPGFKVEVWLEELSRRQDEIDPELMEILISYSDFETFKAQMLSFKNRAAFGDLNVTGKASKIHTDEEDEGEERPELGDLLQIAPASPPSRSTKRICGSNRSR